MKSKNILVVDDDRDIVFAIKKILEEQSFNIFCASNGKQAIEIVDREKIHLIIMDVMMPELDGFSAIMKIRECSNLPIILLSAKVEDSDKVLGLSMGADDYITKPFNREELIARVNAQIRRYFELGTAQSISTNKKIVNGALVMDLEEKNLYVNNELVRLTSTEYKIMELLMTYAGKVFSIEEIYEKVWGEDFFQSENAVMVHVRRIREKIEINPKEPRYLKVVWGIGYKIEKE
ncbi:MAG: response regulator transcription factor [Alphaproteobacteria bacterium]|nr:response regulator transcription factor [Alphaproteobacteria bacterium]